MGEEGILNTIKKRERREDWSWLDCQILIIYFVLSSIVFDISQLSAQWRRLQASLGGGGGIAIKKRKKVGLVLV